MTENPSKLDLNVTRTSKKTFNENFCTIFIYRAFEKKNNQKASFKSMIIPDVSYIQTD